MKKKNKRWLVFVFVALFVVGLLIILGAVASVLAYRQFVRADVILSPSLNFRFGRLQTDEALDDGRGVVVTGVEANSPAAAAGIERGFIILAVDGIEVNSRAELQAVINKFEVGEKVTLTIDTGDAEKNVEVTLGSAGPYLGVGVAEGFEREGFGHMGIMPFLDSPGHFDEFWDRFPEDRPRFGPEERTYPFDELPDFREDILVPVIVIDVIPETPADQVGLESGTIILEVDGQSLRSTQQLTDVIAGMKPGDTINLKVHMDGGIKTIQVTLAAHPDDGDRAYLGVSIRPDLEQYRQQLPEFESQNR